MDVVHVTGAGSPCLGPGEFLLRRLVKLLGKLNFYWACLSGFQMCWTFVTPSGG